MTEYYKSHSRLYVGVDCIIFGIKDGRLSVLLTRRAFEPEKGKWSLFGGFCEADESLDAAAERVLRELTGLSNIYMNQVGAFGAVDRDPGERVVSVSYCALLNSDDLDPKLLREHGAVWTDLEALPELGFDHLLMIDKARENLRQRIMSTSVAFRLLPPFFTLTQLQSLFELVLGQTVDKRNFRKRALENAAIEATDMIDKTGSRRGARLYRFNWETFSRSSNFKF